MLRVIDFFFFYLLSIVMFSYVNFLQFVLSTFILRWYKSQLCDLRDTVLLLLSS